MDCTELNSTLVWVKFNPKESLWDTGLNWYHPNHRSFAYVDIQEKELLNNVWRKYTVWGLYYILPNVTFWSN